MNSSGFDERFEAGDSLIKALDLAAARRPRQAQKRVKGDFPVWLAERLKRRIDAGVAMLTE